MRLTVYFVIFSLGLTLMSSYIVRVLLPYIVAEVGGSNYSDKKDVSRESERPYQKPSNEKRDTSNQPPDISGSDDSIPGVL